MQQQISNGTNPPLKDLALLSFKTWESGFDMHEAGLPIEACKTGHSSRDEVVMAGWRAAHTVEQMSHEASSFEWRQGTIHRQFNDLFEYASPIH